MDQLFENKWLLVGVVVGALVLAVGLTVYFKFGKSAAPTEQPSYVEQQQSDAESEDESADQDTEENRPPEVEQQPAAAVPA